MTPELGHYALVLALFVAIFQSTIPIWGAARNNIYAMNFAGNAAIAQFLCLLIAFGSLTQAFVTSDFSVANVVANSHSLQPMLYKISAVWGNHEGSLLLWVVILAGFGALVHFFGGNLPPNLKSRTLAVQAMIAVGFLLFMLLTSNPFERLDPAPFEGRSLNPLLQDPGLAFHPPMLYIGYVGLSISYSFAVAALIEGKVDAAWARWVRPWTLLAWSFLTAGIMLGSWWAYYELGWGGFWYWDPVENASFMPWLLATALLHSAIVVEKRDTLKTWTILLAIIAFSLSLIGTFLVRSGILTSVHAFANDPERGVFILILLVAAIGGSLTLYAWRAPQLKGGGLFRPISREGGLVLNNLLLTSACATVFLGTLYPLFVDVLGGDRVSVGAPYFNATFVPLIIPLLLALVIGPKLAWKRSDIWTAMAGLRLAFFITVIISLGMGVLVWQKSAVALIGLSIALLMILNAIGDVYNRAGFKKSGFIKSSKRLIRLPRAFWGMTLAHIGVAFLVAGATGATLLTYEKIIALKPGQVTQLSYFNIRFDGANDVTGANYTALRGHYSAINNDGELIAKFTPERRRYIGGGQETTEAGIKSRFWDDIYVVIGDSADDGSYVARLYHKPLAPWLWWGSILMVLGGFISLSDRRLRVGAPKRIGDDTVIKNKIGNI